MEWSTSSTGGIDRKRDIAWDNEDVNISSKRVCMESVGEPMGMDTSWEFRPDAMRFYSQSTNNTAELMNGLGAFCVPTQLTTEQSFHDSTHLLTLMAKISKLTTPHLGARIHPSPTRCPGG